MAETKSSFIPGKDWVWYSRAVYGKREIAAVLESLNSDWLGPGEYTRRFEVAVAKVFGQKFGLFVNSGSSANLLAIDTLQIPRGSEVITPACTFATTVNPLLQCGLIPVLVDIEADTFNIDIDKLEKAITKKTKVLMIPHLVGNLNDMKRLRAIADKHKLKLIEDSCDTIGACIDGKPTGAYADASTTSFYASHIITAAGGGGMLMCKNKEFADDAKMRRDWGRALPEAFDESTDKRFSFSLQGIAHDGKFVFNRIGYNLKPIDLQAAFGLVQLERLPEFARIRRKNFLALNAFFKTYPEHFALPRELPDSDVRWLAYPITLRRESPIKRVNFMRYLEEHKIQTRVLFAGNIARHPAYKETPFRIHGKLTNADMVLERSLLIGCHHGLRDEHIRYVTETVTKFIKEMVH
ncbi:MAG: aminotransferase class I/II-fold pyridoxal phosphate-dependent enzyme [bacterium]|nr:aminotransferase class I/II-fold pyridoxal phosphate-dependent enzyme [bacterium]